LIENQPVLKNPTMKTIQIIIYTYFRNLKTNEGKLLRDIMLVNANCKVRFVHNVLTPHFALEVRSPNNGTKQGTRTLKTGGTNGTSGSLKYRQNKEIAVRAVASLLTNQPHHDTSLRYFNVCRKKDDLADTILQGLYFAHNVLRFEST
jgi:hypothetical protein